MECPVDRQVTLQEITRDNIRDVLTLKVAQDQERFVPSVGDMIARATLARLGASSTCYAGSATKRGGQACRKT